MKQPTLNEKIIFGLKLKEFRKEKQMLLSDLARISGISVSYLNEIEKAKKYPRPEKIEQLATALDIPMADFISTELSAKYTPVADLLDSNFLHELPLDVFGIDKVKIIEMVAEAPTRIGAFISTLVEMSRLHGQEAEHFYIGAMRTYQEMFNNYFEEIESAALQYLTSIGHAHDTETYLNFLKENYGINIQTGLLSKYSNLKNFRSVFKANTRELLLRENLHTSQINYLLLKETAYHFLNLQERSATDKLWRINSFEQILNNFKAHYFASCILVPADSFLNDLKRFIEKENFDSTVIEAWINKYQVSPELLMHRFNLLPQYLGLDKIFFLRVVHSVSANTFEIDKELHLSRRHDPQANRLKEHYCRRALSVSVFKKLKESDKNLVVDVQRSVYFNSSNEYICLSVAQKYSDNPDKMISITAGLYLDEHSMSKLKFIHDSDIKRVVVNVTCERCSIADCQERAFDPTILIEKERRKKITKAIDDLLTL